MHTPFISLLNANPLLYQDFKNRIILHGYGFMKQKKTSLSKRSDERSEVLGVTCFGHSSYDGGMDTPKCTAFIDKNCCDSYTYDLSSGCQIERSLERVILCICVGAVVEQ